MNEMNKVCIIGIGLIGGSIGIDIKTRKLARQVVGLVRRRETIDQSLQKEAVDSAVLDMETGVKDADLVILAMPISVMPQIARLVRKYIKKDTIVIDIASVKGELVSDLEEILGVNYVGTHPMAGSDKKGVMQARKGLFEGAVCIITPTAKTKPVFLKTVRDFWGRLGARVIIMSPAEHDITVALASHLPHLLAACLVNTAASQPQVLSCAGSGFRDTTRIAAGQPALWKDILYGNRREIVDGIDKFEKELAKMKSFLKAGRQEDIFNQLEKARKTRDSL